MTYSVVTVSDKWRMAEFLRLPFDLYRNDPLWVAPLTAEVRRTLDPRKNPYFANAALRLFVCYRAAIPVARLAVVISGPHQKAFGVRAAFFGFFESVNDEEAARRLFAEAEAYCRSENVDVLEGPFNPHHYSEIGLQIDRFGTAPSFFQPYNPPFYLDLLEKAGFRISARFQTMANDDACHDVVRRVRDLPAGEDREGYTVRSFSPADKARDLALMRDVNNDAFAENWHFLPLSPEEYAFSAKFMSFVTRPDLIKFVEHRGRPVAVLHCVLDINPLLRTWRGAPGPVKLLRFFRARRSVPTIIIFTAAIRKAYRHSRVSQLLFNEFCRMAGSFKRAETTWLAPDNPIVVKGTASLGMTPDKHFAVYAKEIRP